MAKIPSTKKQLVAFRGPSSSAKYNEFQNDAFYDITELFNMANTLEQELGATVQVHNLTSHYQEMRIRELEQELYRVTNLLDTYREGTGKYSARLYVDDMEPDLTVNDYEQAHLDTFHGLVHLPITGKMNSKVYIYDEVANEIVTPKNLQVTALPEERRGWKIEDNELHNAFNGDNTSYWHRRIVMPIEDMPKKPVQTELIVKLPENIISNKDVNMIYVHPFPLNSMTIDKIEYRVDDEWRLLPGYPMDALRGRPAPMKNAGNLKFCFQPIAMNEVKITMTQPRYVEENYQRVYHFGIQELGIFHVDYQSEMGKFTVPVVLKGASPNKLITGIKPKFRNETAISDKTETKSSVFGFNLYTVDEKGQKHYTKDTFPIAVNTTDLLVKATVYTDPNSNLTPALESIELTYEDV